MPVSECFVSAAYRHKVEPKRCLNPLLALMAGEFFASVLFIVPTRPESFDCFFSCFCRQTNHLGQILGGIVELNELSIEHEADWRAPFLFGKLNECNVVGTHLPIMCPISQFPCEICHDESFL